MDLQQYVMAGFILIGLVNGLQFAFDRDWYAFAKFIVAVVAGGVFGYLHWFGLPTLEIGLAVGISSSGAYKLAMKLGGK